MVELVLYDTGRKTLGSPLEPVCMAVQTVNAKFSPARNASSQLRNAEASFPVFEQFFIENCDLGIDKHRQGNIPPRPVALDDGNGERVVNLRSRQAYAVIVDHGLNHVID